MSTVVSPPRRRRSRRLKPSVPPTPLHIAPLLIGLCAGVVLLLIGGYVYFTLRLANVEAASAETWPELACRVDRIQRGTESGRPLVGSFSFDAPGGRRMIGDRITLYTPERPWLQRALLSQAEVEALLTKLAPGSRQQCRVNPANRSEVVLAATAELGGAWWNLGPGLSGCGMFLLLLQAYRIWRLMRAG